MLSSAPIAQIAISMYVIIIDPCRREGASPGHGKTGRGDSDTVRDVRATTHQHVHVPALTGNGRESIHTGERQTPLPHRNSHYKIAHKREQIPATLSRCGRERESTHIQPRRPNTYADSNTTQKSTQTRTCLPHTMPRTTAEVRPTRENSTFANRNTHTK